MWRRMKDIRNLECKYNEKRTWNDLEPNNYIWLLFSVIFFTLQWIDSIISMDVSMIDQTLCTCMDYLIFVFLN